MSSESENVNVESKVETKSEQIAVKPGVTRPLMFSDDKKFKVSSRDGDVREVDGYFAFINVTIKDIVMDMESAGTNMSEQVVPLPEVSTVSLDKMIEYCNYHRKVDSWGFEMPTLPYVKLKYGSNGDDDLDETFVKEQQELHKKICDFVEKKKKETNHGENDVKTEYGVCEWDIYEWDRWFCRFISKEDREKITEETGFAFFVNQDILQPFFLASNYLNNEHVRVLCAKTYAEMIREMAIKHGDKAVEKTRELLGIVSDFTPEEERELEMKIHGLHLKNWVKYQKMKNHLSLWFQMWKSRRMLKTQRMKNKKVHLQIQIIMMITMILQTQMMTMMIRMKMSKFNHYDSD